MSIAPTYGHEMRDGEDWDEAAAFKPMSDGERETAREKGKVRCGSW